MSDIDLVEYNEAYATAAVVIARELNIDRRSSTSMAGAVCAWPSHWMQRGKDTRDTSPQPEGKGSEEGTCNTLPRGGNAVAVDHRKTIGPAHALYKEPEETF